MIHGLRRQGQCISAIARKVGSDRKRVRKYLEQGRETPIHGPRPLQGSVLDPYREYLSERVRTFPDLTGRRLLRALRPPRRAPFAVRFETPPGKQARVDLAEFKVEFTDEPGVIRKVWMLSLVPGRSRWLWNRFVS